MMIDIIYNTGGPQKKLDFIEVFVGVKGTKNLVSSLNQDSKEQESKRKHEAASFVYFHGLVDGRVGPAAGVRFDQSNRTVIIIQCYTTQPQTPAPTWRRRKSLPLPYLLVSNHSEIGKL